MVLWEERAPKVPEIPSIGGIVKFGPALVRRSTKEACLFVVGVGTVPVITHVGGLEGGCPIFFFVSLFRSIFS